MQAAEEVIRNSPAGGLSGKARSDKTGICLVIVTKTLLVIQPNACTAYAVFGSY